MDEKIDIHTENLKKLILPTLFILIGFCIGMLVMYYGQKDYVSEAYNFVKINCNNTWGVRIG